MAHGAVHALELADRALERLTSFDATIQTAGGKFDGWYLSFSEKQEEVEKGKFKYKSYRPQLSENPRPRMNLHIFIDGP